MNHLEAEQLARQGIEALRRGDSGSARRYFEELIESDSGIQPPWFLLAQACHHQGDLAAEVHALERQLASERDHLASLLMIGEAKVNLGDDRAASAFYSRALSIASQYPESIPQQLHVLLARAENWLGKMRSRFEDHLRSQLNSVGMNRTSPPRVAKAVEMLLGETQLYLQQPTMFYLPGLPQRQFYEREEFDWIADLEAATPVMQQELAGVLSTRKQFDPYIEVNPNRPGSFNPLAGDNMWGAWYLWKEGELVTDHVERCPQTVNALKNAPMPQVKTRSPMALYSVLEPGAHIIPHHGALNTRLICHIPLIVPADCALRVGNETRAWEEGRALIFDDSIEHEAWNRSNETRIILLFDIWRPEITAEEREALTVIFEAVDQYDLQ